LKDPDSEIIHIGARFSILRPAMHRNGNLPDSQNTFSEVFILSVPVERGTVLILGRATAAIAGDAAAHRFYRRPCDRQEEERRSHGRSDETRCKII
jgi:hypothetical protein